MWCYNISEFPDEPTPQTLKEAKEKFEDTIFRGLWVNGEVIIPVKDYETMLMTIVSTSLLYYYEPKFFFPNIFIYRFFELNKIADIFDIDPSSPRSQTTRRGACIIGNYAKYFINSELKTTSRQQVCAFLYDFSPNFTPKEKAEIPKPSQVWCIGGLINNEEISKTDFWQASSETKKGDILIHYETSPVSAITCFWIAQTGLE